MLGSRHVLSCRAAYRNTKRREKKIFQNSAFIPRITDPLEDSNIARMASVAAKIEVQLHPTVRTYITLLRNSIQEKVERKKQLIDIVAISDPLGIGYPIHAN
jgi:hypothetical protein